MPFFDLREEEIVRLTTNDDDLGPIGMGVCHRERATAATVVVRQAAARRKSAFIDSSLEFSSHFFVFVERGYENRSNSGRKPKYG